MLFYIVPFEANCFMKRLLYLVTATILSFSFAFTPAAKTKHHVTTVAAKDSVYICNSSTSYAYHSNEYCRGLNRCSHGVLKVSLTDAEKNLALIAG